MKKYLRIPACILYLTAFCCIFIYIFYSFTPAVMITPSSRLALLCSACLTVYFGSILLIRTIQKQKIVAVMKITFAICFALYICLITTLVLFDSYFGRSIHSWLSQWNSEALSDYLKYSFNIIPFATILSYIEKLFENRINMNSVVINIVGNIIAFTPFAFFLPLFFKKLRSFSRFLLAMICIVSTVELLQFVLLAGSCDIDDVILNVGGSCMAYGILHIGFFSRIIEKITLLQYRNERKFPRISEHN